MKMFSGNLSTLYHGHGTILGMIAIGLGMLLLYQYGLPQYREYQLRQLEIERNTKVLLALENFKNQHSDYKKQLEEEMHKLEGLREIIRTPAELSSLEEKLEKTADSYEVKLREMKLLGGINEKAGLKGKKTATDSNESTTRYLQLVFAGSYEGIKNFIGMLETKKLYLERLNIVAEKNGHCIVVSCRVRIPVFKML